jgi:hypothetical protein
MRPCQSCRRAQPYLRMGWFIVLDGVRGPLEGGLCPSGDHHETVENRRLNAFVQNPDWHPNSPVSLLVTTN